MRMPYSLTYVQQLADPRSRRRKEKSIKNLARVSSVFILVVSELVHVADVLKECM